MPALFARQKTEAIPLRFFGEDLTPPAAGLCRIKCPDARRVCGADLPKEVILHV